MNHQPPIDWGVAGAVLWHYDTPTGPEPGSFEKALVNAIAHADPVNQYRLAQCFPDYVHAVQLITGNPSGLGILRAIRDRPTHA